MNASSMSEPGAFRIAIAIVLAATASVLVGVVAGVVAGVAVATVALVAGVAYESHHLIA